MVLLGTLFSSRHLSQEATGDWPHFKDFYLLRSMIPCSHLSFQYIYVLRKWIQSGKTVSK